MRSNFWLVLTTSACTAVVVCSLTLGVQALAQLDGDDGTDDLPRVVPYEGFLDLDGAPFTGFLDMRFTFYDDASAGEAVWREEWTQAANRAVQLFAGRFAANLGSYDDGGLRGLEEVVADAGTVYLAIEVKRTDEDEWVALGGRQRINPVPYAIWSTKSSDLDVGGDLAVAGAAHVQGAFTTSNTASIGGNLTVAGSDLVLGTNDGRSAGADARQQALVHSSDGQDALIVNYAGTFGGGTRVQSALSVTGALTVTGNLTDDNGDVTIDDGLVITGVVSDSNGDLVINDGLDVAGITDVQGNVFDSNSDVTIDDGLIVTGNISDSNGDVVINDGLDVSGATELTGDLSDTNGDVTVNDGLTVTGNLSVTNNTWSNCDWYGETRGTQANGETLSGYCPDGYFVVGYERWHGNFDYGIETLKLRCCKL